MLNLLILILIHSLIIIQSEFTCTIENSKKIDCASDIAQDTGNLPTNCAQRGCCYDSSPGSSGNIHGVIIIQLFQQQLSHFKY